MGKIYTSITELVGRTPLLEIKNYERNHNLKARLLVKLEYFNPNQSVKDRTALSMVEEAERQGLLHPGDTIAETTSGNTGIGLASVAAAKGYKFRVYMQDGVSRERFQTIQALGGETIRMSEVPEVAKTLEETGDFIAAVKTLGNEVLAKEEHVFFVDQMTNPANPAAHIATTGPEIWEDTDGKVDILVAGVGTGGTISGTGKYLKEKNPDIKVVAIQPGEASRPSEEHPTPEEITGVHPFYGIPEDQIPATVDQSIYDSIVEVDTPQAYKEVRELAKTEGFLVGTSSGAALAVARELAEQPENEGKTIVAILPDTGLRYLSTNLFNENFIV